MGSVKNLLDQKNTSDKQLPKAEAQAASSSPRPAAKSPAASPHPANARIPARAFSRRALLAVALCLAFLSTALTSCSNNRIEVQEPGSATEANYFYTIPLGAGEALDAGSPLEILPARLDAQVGESIEIVNEDDRGHLVGPWFVGAHETLRQEFVSAGEFIGECTVHPSGQIIVVIEAEG